MRTGPTAWGPIGLRFHGRGTGRHGKESFNVNRFAVTALPRAPAAVQILGFHGRNKAQMPAFQADVLNVVHITVAVHAGHGFNGLMEHQCFAPKHGL